MSTLPRFSANSLLHAGLFAVCALHVTADPFALNISGSLTSSSVNGASLGAGSYTQAQLAAAGSAVGNVTSNGLTGVALWSLLGGTSSGSSDVAISTPAIDNSKNSILRSYIVATSITGAQSVISLGEIDPFFGGTGATPDFIAFSGTDGKAELVYPGSGSSGRNVIDLASLQVLAAPALPNTTGSISSSLALTGNVAQPGTYSLARLQSLVSTTQTVSGDTYTGVPLWNFLSPTSSNVLNQYVVAAGTDGYEVVYSLAEIDPAFGAPEDLLPYADNGGQFPNDGVARIIIPGDNHQGRYVSNLDFIAVAAIPEPATAPLLVFPLIAICLFQIRLKCREDKTRVSLPPSE